MQENIVENTVANTGRILFVDDEENIAKTLLRHFKGLGYHVFIANNGCDALEILSKENIDVVVSDMRMPEMDGETLLKEVANKWPDTSRILLTGYADLNSVISAVNNGKIHYCLTKPWEENQIESAIRTSVETKTLKEKNKELQTKINKQNSELQNVNEDLKQKVEERTHELNKTLKEMKNNYASLVKTCSNLINLYDPKYTNHNERVGDLASKLAKKLKISNEGAKKIYFAALLYNIGKIGVNKQITDKPYRTLQPEQKRIFELYPIIGATALSSMDSSEQIVKIILGHREKYNGKGYPKKLFKENIPMNARILSLVIDFEQLQMGLILPEKLSITQSIAYLESYRGIHYDPVVVDAFVDLLKTLPVEPVRIQEYVISSSKLRTGMVLTRDLMSSNGMLLLAKGTVFTDDKINNLKRLDDFIVWVKTN